METSARQLGTYIWRNSEGVWAAGVHLGVTGMWWVFKTTTPDEISKGVSAGVRTLRDWAGEVELAKSAREDLRVKGKQRECVGNQSEVFQGGGRDKFCQMLLLSQASYGLSGC